MSEGYEVSSELPGRPVFGMIISWYGDKVWYGARRRGLGARLGFDGIFFFFFFKFVHYLYSSNRLPDGIKFTVAMLTMQTDPAVQTR